MKLSHLQRQTLPGSTVAPVALEEIHHQQGALSSFQGRIHSLCVHMRRGQAVDTSLLQKTIGRFSTDYYDRCTLLHFCNFPMADYFFVRVKRRTDGFTPKLFTLLCLYCGSTITFVIGRIYTFRSGWLIRGKEYRCAILPFRDTSLSRKRSMQDPCLMRFFRVCARDKMCGRLSRVNDGGPARRTSLPTTTVFAFNS